MKRIFIPIGFRFLLIFLVPGLLWVFFSDLILFRRILPKDSTYLFYDNLKDASFVIVMSVVLYIFFRRSRKKLKASQQQYLLLFERNPHPMLIVEARDGKILSVNKTAIGYFGYTKIEFAELQLQHLVAGDEEQHWLQESYDDTGKKPPVAQTWGVKNKVSTVRLVQISSNPVIFDGKQCRLIMFNDITALVSANQKIKLQYEQLRQVAFVTSHNLRAPLTNIMALAHMASQQQSLVSDDYFIHGLSTAAAQMDKILHEIVRKSSMQNT